MADRTDRPDPADDERDPAGQRRAAADDFMRSHAAAELVARVNEDAEAVQETLERRGVQIDRAEAWDAAMRSAIHAGETDPAAAALQAELDAAAARWDDGATVDTLDVDSSRARARDALTAAFPDADIDVTDRDDAWGSWLVLEWTDGPTEQDVTDVAQRFVGVHELDGRHVRYAFYGLSCWRDYSPTATAWAERTLAAAGITRDDGDPDYVTGLPDDPDVTTITVEGTPIPIDMDPPLERLIRTLLDARTL